MPNRVVILILSILIFPVKTFPNLSAGKSVLPSIEWQKLQLEDKIRTQVEETLRSILTKKQYIVDIGMEVSEPPQPDFLIAPPPPVKQKIRYSNKKLEEAPGDYVVFSKIGMEAPIVADFQPPQEGKKSEFEHLWKYNQSLNVFSNLKSVNIKVSIDDRLSEDTIKKAEKALNETNFNLGKVLPSIIVSPANMVATPKVIKKMTLLEKLEWLSKFANMIGLIAATLLAAISAFILFRKYAALKQEEMAQAKAAVSKDGEREKEEDDKKEEQKDESSPFAGGEISSAEKGLNGVERFKTFFDKSPLEATLVIKRWLASEEEIDQKALFVLVQKLENEDLTSIFELLTQKDREIWKKTISKFKYIDDMGTVTEYIGAQVVGEIIVPPLLVDQELCDLLLNTSEIKAAQFIQDDPKFGPLMLNVMSTRYVANILAHLNADEVNEAISVSFSFDDSKIKSMTEEFKRRLRNYSDSTARSHFLEKILELIPIASPESEGPLFQSLADGGYVKELKELASQHVPVEIIKSFKSEDISELLSPYSMAKKVELVASLDDQDLREVIVNSFAAEGTTAREMLELELENYETDFSLKKHLKENKRNIWLAYVRHCRKQLVSNPKLDELKEKSVNSWIAQLTGEEMAEIEQLKMAA